jgi:DNA-binding CsgD family transcriptional regulator
MLECRLDEALEQAQAQLAQARQEHDVEGIIGAAYAASQVLITRGRTSDMRTLLSSVLSIGVLPALQRPQFVALISMAASLAVDDGRASTARALTQQALELRQGPGPFPLGSPTQAIANLEGENLPAPAARALTAQRLWDEAVALMDDGYLMSGYVCGVLAVAEEPTPERGDLLGAAAAKIEAPIVAKYADFVEVLCFGDAESLVALGAAHADEGLVWSATHAYSAGLAALRSDGSATRAAEVHDDARRRLAVWGDEAAASLRSMAEDADLTAREGEIARLAADGLSNLEISRRLLISVRTVENHLHRVFRKLGVDNRTELTRVLSL